MKTALLLTSLFFCSLLSAQKAPINNESIQGGGMIKPYNLTATPRQDSIIGISLRWLESSQGGNPIYQYILRKHDTLDFDTIARLSYGRSFIDSTAEYDASYVYMVRYAGGQLTNSIWTVNHDSNKDTALLKKAIAVRLNENKTEILKTYPNPVLNTLHVEGINKFETLLLSDLTGRMLNPPYNLSKNTLTLDLSSLPTGIYFLTINNTSSKIIKR